MDSALDRFSEVASGYAQFRPVYPPELYSDIFSLVTQRQCAWDAGTGNGQVARVLSPAFDKVIATDISASQIAHAHTDPKIEYHVRRAEDSGIAENIVNLVTVAQAVHWFDADRFADEVIRVCTRESVLAIWGYGLLECEPALDRLIRRLYTDILKGFWDPHRELVDREYADLQFPFTEHDSGRYLIEKTHTVDSLLGYLRTWSAVFKYLKHHGKDPVHLIEDDLTALLGDQQTVTRTPVFLRIWKVNA